MEIIFTSTGNARCIYSETLDLSVLGHIAIERASHVEPDEDGRWLADLGPVGGPILGPFGLRSEALEAERLWLQRHWLMRSDL
jgi:hypothetical protein